MLRDDSAGVRRQAATTLGLRGDSSCVAELVLALRHADVDHPAEHAIVYALIEIGDAEAVRQAISPFNGQLNTGGVRGVLMALDQIDGSSVKFSELQMALHSDDLATLRTVARIAKKHPEWSEQIAEVLQNVLSQQSVEHETALVSSLLTSFANLPAVAEVVGKVLADDQFTPQSKQLVTKSLASASRIEPHASWIEPLRKQLVGSDDKRLAEAIAVAAALGGFAAELRAIADDPQRTMTLRMSALAAITLHSGKLDDATLKQLIELYQRSGSPEASGRAAQIIGAGQLSNEQLSQVVPLLKNASPAELRDLINTFQRNLKQQQAIEFLDGLEASAAWTSLAEHELSEVIKGFPAETLERANKMLDQLKGRQQEKLKRLEQLRTQLAQGDAQRGQKVFASEKAKCAACHRIGQSGVAVGPDLTTIGANRSANDLLESIVFPSASIVRDYEPRKVLTADGRALTGLVVAESASEMQLQLANGERVQLQQSDIEQITPSTVSIMPAGLEEALTEQELLDVVSYLQGLRSAP
jgi:putative heme-binding domain-containing protein